MKKKFIQILIVLLITTSCGFKVYNQADLIKYSIEEIRTTGDKRINYNFQFHPRNLSFDLNYHK